MSKNQTNIKIELKIYKNILSKKKNSRHNSTQKYPHQGN
jgi:hypothetical protein